jgi:hypothetical protein
MDAEAKFAALGAKLGHFNPRLSSSVRKGSVRHRGDTARTFLGTPVAAICGKDAVRAPQRGAP